MNESTELDDKFFEILKESKNLPNFLNAIFGFLKRRTDFYYIATDPHSQVGLPEGVAEQYVKEIFYKWKQDSYTNTETVEQDMVPPAIEEVIINDTETITLNENDTKDERCTQFSSSESYNGAVFENYTWTQTITDIDIIIKVPKHVTSKDIALQILPQKITVKIKNDDSILLEGILCEKVKHNDVIWSLDKQNLEIHLDKASELWWNCLVMQEPKIDINNIDCSRPYEELPAEAQAKIEELSWNQEQKRLGLPTSDEIILKNKLKGAWNAEGTPFKAQFDPNIVTFEH